MAEPDDPLAAAAVRRGNAPAIIDGDRTIAFAELDAMVDTVAANLAAGGARPGERVAWCGRNCAEVIVLLHACGRAQLAAVPIPYTATPAEAEYLLADSGSALALADAAGGAVLRSVAGSLPALRQVLSWGDGGGWDDLLVPPSHPSASSAAAGPAEPVDEVLSSMIYTSGTSGRPKGTRRRPIDPMLALALLEALRLSFDSEVYLTAGPLYHSGPQAFAMLTQLVGGTVITAPRFDAVTFLKTAERFGVTTTFASPTHLTRLLATPPDTADASTFSTIIANAAPVPYPVKVAWVERFGDDNLFEVYGATELGVVTVLPPEEQLRRPGSCGRPYGGIELLVADEAGAPVPAGTAGELFVRGPGGMSGYHGDAAGPSTRPGGWMSVGDVASLDEDGFVYIRDRLTDMVISGGVNVYPAEVEAVLLDHPAVVDVAVFGVPDDDLGERVVAVVATGEDATVDVAELRALARERLAGPKRPKEYEVRESLPRTDSGKLFKRLLRHEFAVRTPDPPRD